MKNLSRPVFCGECKHAWAAGRSHRYTHLYATDALWRCLSNKVKKHNHAKEWLECAECFQKNANNDCCEFERKVGFWCWLEDKLGL